MKSLWVSGECRGRPLLISQHWFRSWLGTNSIMMLVKFLISANQKHRIWSMWLTKINCKEKLHYVGKIKILIKLVFLSETLECMELEFYLKSSTGRSYSNKNNTEAICEWRLNYGKYVMNRTDLQLVCYSTFCNQYIASMYYPYKHFVSFFLLYILHKYLIAFACFSMRHIVKI